MGARWAGVSNGVTADGEGDADALCIGSVIWCSANFFTVGRPPADDTGVSAAMRLWNPVAMTVIRTSSVRLGSITDPKMMLASGSAAS